MQCFCFCGLGGILESGLNLHVSVLNLTDTLNYVVKLSNVNMSKNETKILYSFDNHHRHIENISVKCSMLNLNFFRVC